MIFIIFWMVLDDFWMEKLISIERLFWNGKIKTASRGCVRLIFGLKRWKNVIKQISLVIL